MAQRTLIRPTGFVDSPFGHDGKVARLAGGLSWFAAVELLSVEDGRRVAAELIAVDALGPEPDWYMNVTTPAHMDVRGVVDALTVVAPIDGVILASGDQTLKVEVDVIPETETTAP